MLYKNDIAFRLFYSIVSFNKSKQILLQNTPLIIVMKKKQAYHFEAISLFYGHLTFYSFLST